MNVRTLSKKTLALLLTLAMLLSCMVWSGVSAAVTTAYQLDFDAYASALESYYHGINAQTYSNATIDVSAAAGGLKKHVRGVHADVLNSGETGHNRVMQMKFYDPTTVGTTVSNPGIEVAGFRITETGASVSVPSGKTYVVIFDYKVIDVTVPVDLLISVGSSHWGTERPHDNDKKGSSFSLAPGCETGVWKKGVTILNLPSGGQAMHFVMDAGKGYTPAQKAGTEVLIDNIMIYNSLANGQAAGLCQFTVNYNDTTVADQSINGVIGQTYTPPTPTRTGYTFTGWYTDANCTVPYTGTITAGLTGLYAGWEASDNTAYIDFDCGDVPVSVATLAGDAGTTVALPDGPVVSDGSYKFLRWEDANGSPVTEYTFPAAGETAVIKGVFAPLVRHEYHYNNGTNTFKFGSVYAGEKMTYPTMAYRKGYTHVGWNTAADGTGVAYDGDSICGNEPLQLYAQWSFNSVENHDSDAFKTFFDKYKGDGTGNNGEGYAKAPAGSRGGVMAGNGSGVILSYLHNYNVATGTDVPGTPAEGGYSAAIHLSGNGHTTAPKHMLTTNESHYYVKRGYGYTVKMMVYVDEDITLPLTLGTNVVKNEDFNAVSQEAFKEEAVKRVDLTGGQWQEVTLEIAALQADERIANNADDELKLYMGINNWSAKVYVYVDYVRIYEHAPLETYTMNFEDYESGTSLNVSGQCSAWVTDTQNATFGGSKALYINSHWGGATRAQFLIKDAYGKPIVVEDGASYRVNFKVLVPTHDTAAYSTNVWFAAADATGSFGGSGGTKSKYTLRVDTATSKPLGAFEYQSNTAVPANTTEYKQWNPTTGYQWVNYTVTFDNVTLTEESKASACYLRMGIGYASATENQYYIDDIVVTKTSADPVLYENLMSFESQSAGTDLELRQFGGKDWNGNGTAKVSTDISRTGNHSLRITSKVIQSGNLRAQFILKDDKGEPIRVTPGQKYTMSFYVYFEDAGYVPGLYYWLAGADEEVAYNVSGDKDKNKIVEPNWGPEGIAANASVRTANVPETYYGMWHKVSTTFTVTQDYITEDSYLLLGIAHRPRGNGEIPGVSSGQYDREVAFYLDDLSVTPTVAANSKMNKVDTAYQYVENGSAIYEQEGVEKTAFRVAATYTADIDGVTMNKIRLGGVHYEIAERGLLLGYADKLSGRVMDINTTKEQGLAGKHAIREGFDQYWAYNKENNVVTYTILVKGVTKAMKDMKFVARAYVKLIIDGREYYLYGDTSTAFTPQSLYDASGTDATWFTEEAAQ